MSFYRMKEELSKCDFYLSGKTIRILFFLILIVSPVVFFRNNSPSNNRNFGDHTRSYLFKSNSARHALSIKVMTWNVQGSGGAINNVSTSEQVDLILRCLSLEQPDIVFFQEVHALEVVCRVTQTVYACSPQLWSLRLLYRKSKFNIEGYEEIFLNRTNISHGWNNVLQIVKLKLTDHSKTRLALMNTHLLPFPPAVIRRLDQLRMCFEIGGKFSKDYNVILGGDLNMEELEDFHITPVFKDVWKECGYSERNRYTWDATNNAKAKAEMSLDPSQKPRVRYDRIYFYRYSKFWTLEPTTLKLTGKEKVNETDIPVSDHWALLATFKLTKSPSNQLNVCGWS